MNTMNTLHGHTIDFKTGDVSGVHIEEIAHVLALTNRFGGHTKRPYSVAQHSVEVSNHIRRHLALEGLLHDAGEVYIGDVVRPLKHLFSGLSGIEMRFMRLIREIYCLSTKPDDWEEVSRVDRRVLLTEMQSPEIHKTRHIIGWEPGRGPYQDDITPYEDWEEAKNKFLERFQELWVKRLKKDD
jgi:hypothetical protein